jgi:hypothetical protein
MYSSGKRGSGSGYEGEEIDVCHPPTQETTALAVEECELRMETFRRNLTLLRRISLPGG